jgi:hypothetical protein
MLLMSSADAIPTPLGMDSKQCVFVVPTVEGGDGYGPIRCAESWAGPKLPRACRTRSIFHTSPLEVVHQLSNPRGVR